MTARALIHLASVAQALAWLRSLGVDALTVDSREVAVRTQQGQRVAFVAWPGAARDGRDFALQALQQGARAVLVEADGVDNFTFDGAHDIATLRGLKTSLAQLAHEFHGMPSESLRVLAVTGTNGKTSTAWWTAQALSSLGQPCGVVGTLGVGQPGSGMLEATGLTTPDPVTLHATFRRFVNQGLQAAAIEASSIGIAERRLDATRIAVAQFTNFTQDHLDYHGDMQAYWQAKAELFEWPGLQAVVLNADDARAPEVLAIAHRRALAVWTYAMQAPARIQASAPLVQAQGMRIDVTERDESLSHIVGSASLDVPLIGDFNVANLLCVIGGLRALGVPLPEAARACAGLTPVPGRMQQVSLPDAPGLVAAALPLAVVDYAHTPDALHKTLLALKPITRARGGRLWCVMGCGGNRDATKRPLMGAMADQHADELVLTSDNPRNEAPAYILSQILTGVVRSDRLAVIDNRRDAIVHALTTCAPQDVVLIAGKGHEAYQEVAGERTPFSDVEEATAALHMRRAA